MIKVDSLILSKKKMSRHLRVLGYLKKLGEKLMARSRSFVRYVFLKESSGLFTRQPKIKMIMINLKNNQKHLLMSHLAESGGGAQSFDSR